MSESWLELVEPCSHGRDFPHDEFGLRQWVTPFWCPGGRRRRVTINYEAARDTYLALVTPDDRPTTTAMVRAVVDAALTPSLHP